MQVRNVVDNEDCCFKDGHGAPMPPCIAMKKGESLDIWSERGGEGLDMITTLQVKCWSTVDRDGAICAVAMSPIAIQWF